MKRKLLVLMLGIASLATAVFCCNSPCAETTSTPIVFLSADSQPTPWPGVAAILNALNPKPNEVLLDPGCGHDARLLIAACQYFDTQRAIGIEINPDHAASARRAVETAGFADRIEIVNGDSTQVYAKADIGVAYMWPEFLTKFRPRIQRLNRFVSYGFDVPGLQTISKPAPNGGTLYVWSKPIVTAPSLSETPLVTPPVALIPITSTAQRTVLLPRGSWCQVCGRNCSNPMAHQNVTTIVGYQNQPAASSPSGRWVMQKVCVNGVCSYQRVWQPD